MLWRGHKAHRVELDDNTMTKRKNSKDLKPAGRPSSYTEETATEICRRIVAGEGLKKICETPGMPHRATAYEWLASIPTFNDMYARAREHQADAWVDELREIADDTSKDYIEVETPDGRIERRFDGEHVQRSRLRIDTIKWLVGKHAPRRFGEKVAVDLTAKVDLEDLSDEQLMERTRKALLDMGINEMPKLLPLVPGEAADTTPEGED